MKDFIYFIIFIVILIFVIKWLSKFKIPKLGSLSLVTGGVKTGKSTLAVAMCLKEYKSRLLRVKISNFIRKLLKRDLLEEPLLYSNIPLNCDYVPLTDDLLLREKRFVYGSVIYVCEASLVADSTLIKDLSLNDRLLLFNKLIGHETKGGCLIYDTQCIGDIHFSIKRSLSQYIYIHHLVKLPLIPYLVAYVRELNYSDDNSTQNVFNDDVEVSLKKVLISKKTWRYFDCYCYSHLTDNLPVEKTKVNGKCLQNLKCDNIVTFNTRRKELYSNVKKEDK